MKKRRNVNEYQKGIMNWAGSYLVVLVIPVIICTVFYLYSFLSIWEETRTVHYSSLQVASEQLDSVFKRALLMEYGMNKDESLAEVMKLTDLNDSNSRYALVKAYEDSQSNYGYWDEGIFSYSIYFPQISAAVFMDRYTVTDKVASEFSNKYKTNGVDWSSFLNMRHNRTFFGISNNRGICYITSFPKSGTRMSMNVILELDTNYIEKVLSYLDVMRGGGFMILDERNDMVMAYGMDEFQMDDNIVIESESDYHVEILDGQRVLLACIESEIVDIKYVSVIPFNLFLEKALHNLSIFFVALILCILIGLVVSFFYAIIKRNMYDSLHRAVERKLRLQGSTMSYKKQKEISQAIDNIVTEYEKMHEQMEAEEDVRKSFLVSSALEGFIPAEKVELVFGQNNIAYDMENYILILFQPKQFGYMFDNEMENIIDRDKEYMQSQILNFVEILGKNGFTSEIVSMADKIACIIDFAGLNKETCYLETEKSIQKWKDDFGNKNMLMSIAVSDMHSTVVSLSNAYSEALRVMEYQAATGNFEVIYYRELIRTAETRYLFSIEREVELTNLLKCGDEKGAILLVKDIYEDSVMNQKSSKELLRCMLWDMAACLLKFENNIQGKLVVPDVIKWLEGFKSSVHTTEKLQLLEERIVQVCKSLSPESTVTVDDITHRIKKYIYENCKNPNLSNVDIAEQFHMNASYLSALFKEKTGMNLLNFIHQVRLEEAKRMLESTDLSVEQIAVKVGYSNGKSLTRLFKKYENITPASYRKNHKHEM